MKNNKSFYHKRLAELNKQSKKDKRYKSFAKQYQKRGFCEADTWSLFNHLAEIISPRLEAFKKYHGGRPIGLSGDEWDTILDKMIWSFNCAAKEYDYDDNPKEQYILELKKSGMEDIQAVVKASRRYNEGFRLFYEYYHNLWW